MSRFFNGTSAGLSTGFNVFTGQKLTVLMRSNQSVSGGFRTLANMGTQDSNERFIISWASGNVLDFYVRTGTGWRMTGTGMPSLAGWKTLVVTFDYDDIQSPPRMFVRIGPSIAEYPVSKITSGTGVPTDGQTLRVGRTNSGRWITGYVDQYAMWQRILDPDEIASLMFRGPLAHLRGINLWWDFLADRFVDSSGNARPPTNGGTTFSATEFGPAVGLVGAGAGE